jgi:hypothetical protein
MSRSVPTLGLIALLCISLGSGLQSAPTVEAPPFIRFPDANSRETYFTIHRVWDAWPISKGAGVKVGILDHSFAIDLHDDLYAGGENFQTGEWGEGYGTVAHHGFWMASTLKEVAPEVEVYALGTYSSDETSKVDAMVRAIDWAIARDLDILTYSAARFSPENKPRLDAAVDRAHSAGIITTFIHYPHPGNILPTGIVPRSGDDDREPDLNICHFDYSVIFTGPYLEWLEKPDPRGYRPYLSISSTSPVTAAFVAMLKSVKPDLTGDECRRILRETGRRYVLGGSVGEHTVDIAAALKSLTGE